MSGKENVLGEGLESVELVSSVEVPDEVVRTHEEEKEVTGLSEKDVHHDDHEKVVSEPARESKLEENHEDKHKESSPEAEVPAIVRKSSSSSSSSGDSIIKEPKEIIEAQVEQVRKVAVAGLNTYISQAKDALKENKFILGGISLGLAALLAFKRYKKRS